MTVFLNPRPPAPPRQPSNLLVWSAAVTGMLAAILWTAVLSIMIFVHWGEARMHGDEVRLAYAAIAVSAITTALWAHVWRLRNRYQTMVDDAPVKARLAAVEKTLVRMGDRLEALDGRTQRLANGLEEFSVAAPETSASCDDTADLIRLPRHRGSHLRGVGSA